MHLIQFREYPSGKKFWVEDIDIQTIRVPSEDNSSLSHTAAVNEFIGQASVSLSNEDAVQDARHPYMPAPRIDFNATFGNEVPVCDTDDCAYINIRNNSQEKKVYLSAEEGYWLPDELKRGDFLWKKCTLASASVGQPSTIHINFYGIEGAKRCSDWCPFPNAGALITLNNARQIFVTEAAGEIEDLLEKARKTMPERRLGGIPGKITHPVEPVPAAQVQPEETPGPRSTAIRGLSKQMRKFIP